MILLDTNVISELMRREPDERVIGWMDSLGGAAIATTAITVAELLYGVSRLPAGRRRKLLGEAVRGLIEQDLGGRVEPFDASSAAHYAALVSEREAAGRPISVPDAQIAAICRKLGATLATRNTDDFQAVGIDLIDPWQQGAHPHSSSS
ncbi:MAG TPA: type II toxin-antitoxin system VapC family toxin [Solirubrobacteraceae bacterium]|nr:type II toxin-antitoxin system VapC family toxin [Solirubrobacteraceae bacterium]